MCWISQVTTFRALCCVLALVFLLFPRIWLYGFRRGSFVDMSEFLQDSLGVGMSLDLDGKENKKNTNRKQVMNILDWIKCFGLYMAVRCDKEPHRFKEFVGYQNLVIEASMEYQGDTWMGYDRRFRQGVPDTVWSKIDPILWNIALTGQAKALRCKFCFSLSHSAAQCDWAPPVVGNVEAGSKWSRGRNNF